MKTVIPLRWQISQATNSNKTKALSGQALQPARPRDDRAPRAGGPKSGRMKTIAWGILVAALACGSGCARPDWIEQTLVTVDVTGTWQGTVGGTVCSGGGSYEITLSQLGPKLNGFVRREECLAGPARVGEYSGSIVGTVAGDVFSFSQTNGSLKGEMTVSEDEMTGVVFGHSFSARPITLRRVDSPARPKAQEP